MPMFKRGNDVADFSEELRGFLTEHGWQALDEAPADAVVVESTDEHDEPPADPASEADVPETPAVPTTASPADNTNQE